MLSECVLLGPGLAASGTEGVAIGPVVMFWKREPADSRLSRFGGEHRLVGSFGEYQVNTK